MRRLCYLDAKSADTLNAWISFAILRGVEVLDLHLFRTSRMNDYYFFRSELATSSTLKHLRLSRCVLSPPPYFDGFMQLRTLYLERVTVDEVLMASMFFICLFLESLSLLGCSIGSSLIVDGPSLRLNDLKVLNRFNDPANIKISAVNLASFEYNRNIHHISSIKTPRLSRIYFNNHMVQNAFPHALTRFASFPQLETLYLLLEDDLVKELPESLPTFRNLKQLELVVHGPEKSSKDNELVWVLKFLKATPILQELAITARCGGQFYEDQTEIRNIDSGFLHDQLQRVTINMVQGNWYEVELPICVLITAMKLEKMIIDPFGKLYYDGEWSWTNDDASYSPWVEKRCPFVCQQLKEVKTDAQVIIL